MADQNMVRDPESGLMLDALAQRNLANNGSFEEQVKIQGIAPLPGPTDEFMGPVTMPESDVAKNDLDNFLKLRKTNPVSTLTKPQKDTASQILRDYTTASLQLNAAPGETLPDNFDLPPYSENFAPLFDQNFPVIKSTDDLLANGLIDDNGATDKGLLVLDLKKIGALNDDYTLNLTGKALLSNPQEATKPENLAIFMERKRLELDEPEDRSWSDSWKDFKKVLGSAADTLEALIPSGAMPMPSGTSMPMGAYIPPDAEVGYTAEKKAILEGAASGIVQQESNLVLGAKKLGQDILTKIVMEGDEQEVALAALDQKYQRDKQQISAFKSSEALHEITGLTNWVDQMEQVKTELGDEKFKAAQKTGLEGGPMLYSALNPLSAENMAFRVAMSATMAPVKMVSGQMLRARQTAEAFAEQTQSLNAANAAIAKAQATIRFGEKIPELEKAQQAFQVAGDLASAKSIGRNIEKVRSASQKAVFEMEQWGNAASKITQNLERLSANAASANRIVKVADTFAQWPKVITTPVGFTLQKVGRGMTSIDSNLAAASQKLGAGNFYRGMTKLSSLAGIGTIGQVAGLPGELAWFPAVFKAAWSTAPAIEATGDFIRLVGREASAARGAIPMWRKIYRAQNAGTAHKLIAGLMDTATLGGLPAVQNAVKNTLRGTAAGIPLDMTYNYVSSGGELPPGSLKDSVISNAFFAGGGAAIGAVRMGSQRQLKQFQMGDVINFRRSITDADQRMAFDALPRGVRDSIGSYSGANPNLGIRFVKEGGGNFNASNNTVYINPNARNPLKPLLAHELLESMVSRTSMSTSIATILVGDGVQTGGLLRDRNGNLDPDFVEFRDRYNQLRQAEVNRMNQMVEPDKRESFTPLTDREMAKEYFIEMNADDMAAMAESGKLGQLAARTTAARKLVDLGNTILNKASIIKNLHFNMGGMMDSSGRMVTGNGLLADGIKQLPEAKALFQKMVNETAGRPGAVKKMAEKAQGTVIPTSGMDDPIWSEMTSYWKTDKAGNPIKDSSGNWVPLERYVEQAREQAGLLIQADQKQRIANGEVIPKHEIQYSPESGWRGKYFSEAQINIIKDSGYFNDSQIRLFDHINNAAKRGQGERFLMIYNPATSSRLRGRGRKSYETLGPTMKEGGILGFSMGQKGQILIDIIDTQQLHQNVMEQAGKKFGQLLYKGNIDKIMTDIGAVMDLHSQGLPADSHFIQNYGDKWKDYKNFINSTFGDISGGAKARPADYLMINPVLVTDRPSKAVFKTYRLDRLNKATRMEGTTGIPMDYNMVKANYMPEGTPLFTDDGDPVDMRYTPVEDAAGNLRAEPSKKYGKSNESQLDEQGTPVAMDQLPEQAKQMPESLDADYMKAVESGDVEAQQELVDKIATATGHDLSHRESEGGGDFGKRKDVIQFVEWSDKAQPRNIGYGPKNYLMRSSDIPPVPEWAVEWLSKTDDMIYWSEVNNRPAIEGAREAMNPDDIVNGAGMWDDREAVRSFWQENEDRLSSEGIFAFKTSDGAVIFDPYTAEEKGVIKSADPVTRDDSGNVIPLSQRFNEKSSDIRYMPEPVEKPSPTPIKAVTPESVSAESGKPMDLMAYTSLGGNSDMIMSAKWGRTEAAVNLKTGKKQAGQTSAIVANSTNPEDHQIGFKRIDALLKAPDLAPAQKKKLEDFVIRTAGFAVDSPGFRDIPAPKTLDDAKDVIAKVKDRMAKNLLSIYDAVPTPVKNYWQRWYPLAYDWNNAQSVIHKIPAPAIAGINARLSPGKDWIHNVNMTERILTAFSNKISMTEEIANGAGPILDEALREKLKSKDNKAKSQEWKDEQARKNELAKKQIRSTIGMNIENMTPKQAARLIRFHSQVVGENRVFNYFEKGNPVYADAISWQSFVNLEKSINIYRNPTIENISANMGGDHKIRSFYNNQIAPHDPVLRDVTSDTHAVAATYLLPLSQKSLQVSRNFGGASNSVAGMNGMYYIIADAYRMAADARGVEPRAMQSITWEGVRSMFPRGFKQKENIKKVEEIWKRTESQEITKPQALIEINALMIDFFSKNPDSRPRVTVIPTR